ncbi:MAG TPA: HXXEE domain-containing protein [Pyrinomonadaceae bacterium]|nr:HXXEE domain-containing protein [Pyrinomonadaceae bacterium]
MKATSPITVGSPSRAVGRGRLSGRAATSWLYWLIPATFVIHDAEELLTMPGWVSDHKSQLTMLFGRLGLDGLADLMPSTFTRASIAIACVLIIFVVFTAGVVREPQSRMWRYLFGGLLGVFFLHGFTHIGQTVAFGTYTPGVVTAALLVIPVSAFVYRRLLAGGGLDRRHTVIATVVAAALFIPATLTAMLFAAWLD